MQSPGIFEINNRIKIAGLLLIMLILSLNTIRADQPAEASSHHAVILQYHHVSDSTPPTTSIMPEQFRAHLDYLEKHQYNVLPLKSIVTSLQSLTPLPDNSIAITFDDGYRSIEQTAHRLLSERNFPYTIFVSTGLVGSNPDLYLSWSELKAFTLQGATIANHSVDHTHLLRHKPGESLAQWQQRITDEIMRAENDITTRIGSSPGFFAYPYGEYDDKLRSLIADLNLVAFGQHSGALGPESDFLALPRFSMAGVYVELDELAIKLDSVPLPNIAIPPDPVIDLVDRAPLLELQLKPGQYLSEQLACYASGQGRIPVQQIGPLKFTTRAPKPLPPGRSRYNCTMPLEESSVFFWYSQPWIRRHPDGVWEEE